MHKSLYSLMLLAALSAPAMAGAGEQLDALLKPIEGASWTAGKIAVEGNSEHYEALVISQGSRVLAQAEKFGLRNEDGKTSFEADQLILMPQKPRPMAIASVKAVFPEAWLSIDFAQVLHKPQELLKSGAIGCETLVGGASVEIGGVSTPSLGTLSRLSGKVAASPVHGACILSIDGDFDDAVIDMQMAKVMLDEGSLKYFSPAQAYPDQPTGALYEARGEINGIALLVADQPQISAETMRYTSTMQADSLIALGKAGMNEILSGAVAPPERYEDLVTLLTPALWNALSEIEAVNTVRLGTIRIDGDMPAMMTGMKQLSKGASFTLNSDATLKAGQYQGHTSVVAPTLMDLHSTLKLQLGAIDAGIAEGQATLMNLPLALESYTVSFKDNGIGKMLSDVWRDPYVALEEKLSEIVGPELSGRLVDWAETGKSGTAEFAAVPAQPVRLAELIPAILSDLDQVAGLLQGAR